MGNNPDSARPNAKRRRLVQLLSSTRITGGACGVSSGERHFI